MVNRMTLSTARALAWEHYRSARWQEAEQLCRQVTDDDLNDAEGSHLLGLNALEDRKDMDRKDMHSALILNRRVE
jgi:hypothetical protein